MKYALAICLLIVAALIVRPGHVEAQPANVKAMSAIDIVEALVATDPALRDRGVLELSLMDAATAASLGAEILRVNVREAEIVLAKLSIANNAPAAIAACCALDSKDEPVRSAALDALVAMKPAHASEAGAKHLTAARLQIVRQLVTESAYIKHHCEAVQEDFDGQVTPPIRKAMSLTVLLDRFFGVKGLPMLMRRISGYMVGDEPGDEQKKTPHRRMMDERLRRGAAMWCEAIWIEDPAIKFNFSPISPYSERAKAVARINRMLGEFETQEVTYGDVTVKGKRYGDVLVELLSDSVTGIQAAAWLRLHWWSGEKAIIAGEGYAEAVDQYSALNIRQSRPIKTKLRNWWLSYRATTD